MNVRSSTSKQPVRHAGARVLILSAMALSAFLGSCVSPQQDTPVDKQSTSTRHHGKIFNEEERLEALNIIVNHRLEQNIDVLDVSAGVRLEKVFASLEQKGVLRPDPGWFAVTVGDRVVVGWKGKLALSEHTPQWETENGAKIALNYEAQVYTPDLVPDPSQQASDAAADARIWERYDYLMKTEVQPEYAERVNQAGADEAKLEEANAWFDRQAEELAGRIATEFKMSNEEVAKALADYLSRKSSASARSPQSPFKVLNGADIDRLLRAQGPVQP